MIYVQSLTGKKTHLMLEAHWERQTFARSARSLCGNRAPANGWIKTERAVHPICSKCQAKQKEIG